MDADGNGARELWKIGEEVAEWRRLHGYKNQRDFARDVGVSYRKVQRLEQGESLPGWEDIHRLTKFMDVDYGFFVTSEMEKDKPCRNSKPLENRANQFMRRFRMWYENSPYCDKKEEDMTTLEYVMGTIERARKNERK